MNRDADRRPAGRPVLLRSETPLDAGGLVSGSVSVVSEAPSRGASWGGPAVGWSNTVAPLAPHPHDRMTGRGWIRQWYPPAAPDGGPR